MNATLNVPGREPAWRATAALVAVALCLLLPVSAEGR